MTLLGETKRLSIESHELQKKEKEKKKDPSRPSQDSGPKTPNSAFAQKKANIVALELSST